MQNSLKCWEKNRGYLNKKKNWNGLKTYHWVGWLVGFLWHKVHKGHTAPDEWVKESKKQHKNKTGWEYHPDLSKFNKIDNLQH